MSTESEQSNKVTDTSVPTEGKTYYDDDFHYGVSVAHAEKSIRLAFLRKVYGILCAQLCLTTVTCLVFMNVATLKLFIQTSPAFTIAVFVLTFINLFALMAKQKETPTNLYLLMSFTLFEALTLSNIVTMYNSVIVLEAFFLTLSITIALTAYTFQSKHDFSSWGAGLFAVLLMLIVAGFLQIFVRSEIVDLLLAVLGALLFCGFIIYDTNLILRRLSPEDYIIAAISLYLDVINLFIELLRILNHLNNRN